MTETKTALCLGPGTPGSGFATKIAPVEFSFFSRPVTNTVPNRVMTVWEAYLDIKSHRYQPQTALLRSITDKNIARNYKARNFDYVCFAGVFSKRCDAGLIIPSGLMTLDFDHVPNLQELKATLLDDAFLETVLLFTSPSGDGLKAIVSVNLEKGSHLQWFNAISSYISETYQLKVDPTGKDTSRCCFIPHDPQVYIHPDLLTYYS
ncbi:MAG TPA: BT4734/BF3469 family protein [Prolixibacteraceae bacterium]|jgi:hypothetical protein